MRRFILTKVKIRIEKPLKIYFHRFYILAIKIAKNNVDVNTCSLCLKEHYPSEECLQSPVLYICSTMRAFTFAKLVEYFLHVYFRALLFNIFSVTNFMVKSGENISSEVFLYFFYFLQNIFTFIKTVRQKLCCRNSVCRVVCKSCLQIFFEKAVIKNFAIFREKQLFLIKLQTFRRQPSALLKKRFLHRCFSANFANVLRTPFL